ncbi:MAG: 4-(cytidine 5'-diphospho)-2-C-methyl-D-erythritol kinase, partial [Candidatus Zixiibacteriota bacterium]
MLKLRTPAKINLFLNVLGKRPDGYHDICSWFQAIDLFDNITFTKRDKRGLNLYYEGAYAVPTDDRNLIIKTAGLLFDKFSLEGGLDIGLQKNIPVSAGMAGGSSDSAATIYAMNKIYELNLGNEDMKQLGLELGSDIPFFFSSGQAEVTGRGD